MKKIIFTAVIAISCLSFKHADAQISFGIGFNIGNQPDWGPTGYNNASYYYMPDIGAYYDVNAHQYIYLDNNIWVHRGFLPPRYSHYDLYGGYKVVINSRNPWLRDNVYRGRYASFRGRHDQPMIRNSQDARYRNHWNNGMNHGGGRMNHGGGGMNHDGGNMNHGGGQHDGGGQHGGGEHDGGKHDGGKH
jgi:hypothetical protein